MDRIHLAPPKKPWQTVACWNLQGNHHVLVFGVVQDFVHPRYAELEGFEPNLGEPASMKGEQADRPWQRRRLQRRFGRASSISLVLEPPKVAIVSIGTTGQLQPLEREIRRG